MNQEGSMWSKTPHAPSWNSLIGIFLVCWAKLMTEVVLTRYFSFTIWYHFAYVAISSALLGYGSAGSVYAAWPAASRSGSARPPASAALPASTTTAKTLPCLARIRSDPAMVVGTALRRGTGRRRAGLTPLGSTSEVSSAQCRKARMGAMYATAGADSMRRGSSMKAQWAVGTRGPR